MDHFCCFSLGEIFQKSTITSTTGLGDINSPTLLGKVSAENANLSYIVRRSITTYTTDFLFDWIGFDRISKYVANVYIAMSINPERTLIHNLMR